MFRHSTHLPQRLTPAHYSSPDVLAEEIEQMFLPGWHCIGTLADLPRDGDFFTTEILDHPLICWRIGGKTRTYLNVCCHRFSTLTDEPRGNCADRMRCQYHGWEYDSTGRPRKIPDAVSFRPLVKDQLKLREFRTETVGQLIFVSLAEQGPTLAEYLGDYLYTLCQQWFSDQWQPTGTLDHSIECNWKIVAENVLESYHIAALHARTFGMYPSADACHHSFYDHGDECVMSYRDGGRRKREEWAISRLAGVEPAYQWHHLMRYPNLVFANSCLVAYVQCIIPIGPNRVRNLFRAFHYPGRSGPVRRWLADKFLRVGGRRFVRRVLAEDASVYPSVRAGATAYSLPSPGLISTREERIFPFQEYVLKHTPSFPAPSEGAVAPGISRTAAPRQRNSSAARWVAPEGQSRRMEELNH